MGVLRPRKIDPELLATLTGIASILSAGPPRIVNLSSGGLQRPVILGCICRLEELASGKTRVHLTAGKKFTVDEDVFTVISLMNSA